MAHAVGIMGGTFDPIHYGHLVAAEEARARFGLNSVVFVPNGEPPHKKDYPITSAQRRYEMVRLGIGSNPNFTVSRVDIDRPGPSYAVDTIQAFHCQLGTETELYFITGADAILEILTWRAPGQLARTCEFIAVTRPGHDLGPLERAIGPSLRGRVHRLSVPGVAISSTDIRRRAMNGESLRYLTPPSVVRYIATHGLYTGRSMACRAAR